LSAQLSTYLGYVQYHFIGATLVRLAFVMPSFLMVVVIGIAYRLFGGLPWMQALFYGAGAAVIGALVGAFVIIGIRSIIDLPAALIAIVTVIALICLKKIKEPYIIIPSAFFGLTLGLLF
jgi:chromate transporter